MKYWILPVFLLVTYCEYNEITTYPLLQVEPQVSFRILDSINCPDDTVRIAAKVVSPILNIVKLQWRIGSSRSITDSLTVDDSTTKARDTLVTTFSKTGTFKVFIDITDESGFKWTDSALVNIVEPWDPVVSAGNDTTVSISDTVYLRGTAQDNGEILAYAWKIDTAEWTATTTGDTFFVAPKTPDILLCSLKVIDDDERISHDVMSVTVTNASPAVTAGQNAIIGIGEKIHLNPEISDDGTIVKYEWKFGDADWVETSSGDTTIIAPSSEKTYTCVLRVTDDDGRGKSDDIVFTVQLFSQHLICESAVQPVSVYSIDMDADGDIDVLCASHYGTLWYENDGTQQFTERAPSKNDNRQNSVFAIDIDGDGDGDILSADDDDNTIRWYENDGVLPFTRTSLTSTAEGASSVFAIDMDGDDDIDVLSASADDDNIRWYENDGTQLFAERTITSSADGASSVFAIDMDGDGDIDVLSSSSIDDAIRWYENNGSQQFTTHTIYNNADGAKSVFATDIDGDGDIDVVSASPNDNAIRWYENDGTQQFKPVDIYTNAEGAKSVFAVDLDNDGDIDVLSASDYDNTIRWYENDGIQNFTPHSIYTGARKARSVFAVDLDNDGDSDILSASYYDRGIRWFENHLDNLTD